MAFRASLAAFGLALLAGCAHAQSSTLPIKPASEKAQAYGLFLSGQAALEAGDGETAAGYFQAIRPAGEEAQLVQEQAFTAALIAGDIPQAARLVPKDASPQLLALGALVKAVDALADGRGREAYALLSSGDTLLGADQAAALLRPWAAAAAGRTRESVMVPQADERIFNTVAALGQAQLLERARRYEEAETTYKAGMAKPSGRILLGQAFGAFLERRGRKAEALALYDDLIAGGVTDPALSRTRDRAAAGGPAPAVPTIREGAAQTMMAPAAAMVAARRLDSAMIYLRLIQRLDPDREEVWLMLGEIMEKAGDRDGAREAYARIPRDSPNWMAAQVRLAVSYQDEEPAKALAIAKAVVDAAPGEPNATMFYADLLRAQERHLESAQVMDALIKADEARADWRYYYMRGSALEQAGRWAEAEADLKKALALNPDQPELLNYLGYAWVDRGERVKEGLEMIEKAVGQEPLNGAYIDSLGWAHYRLGDYRLAVEKLEQAVQLAPGDPEINDHLGDAYWRAGRRDEARYKWRSVLTLEPPAPIKARAERKLASPLGPDVLVQAASPAPR